MADLIDRRALLRDIEKYHLSDGKFQHWVEVQPSVDAVEVVRCKDCKHYSHRESVCKLLSNNYEPPVVMDDDDYCSRGERKDG